MKVLLDESLDVRLRHDVTGHTAATAAYMGWKGVKNGALIASAVAAGFDVLVTTDRGMATQLNLRGRPIAVAILYAATNATEDQRALIPPLLDALAGGVTPGTFIHIRR